MTYGTLIQTVTVGAGGAANLTFSSIPATPYTDLILVLSGRSDAAYATRTLSMQFNGDTAANYTYKRLIGSGSAATSDGPGLVSSILTNSVIPAATAAANTFSNHAVTISNYSGSTVKSVSIDSVGEDNATAAYQNLLAGVWNSTAAITSITLFTTGNWVQYSTASLYGLTHF